METSCQKSRRNDRVNAANGVAFQMNQDLRGKCKYTCIQLVKRGAVNDGGMEESGEVMASKMSLEIEV